VTPRCWRAVIQASAAIGRGWASCWLRELSIRWPRLATIARRVLPGLSRPSSTRPAPGQGRIRFDTPAVGPVPSSMVPPSNRKKLALRRRLESCLQRSAPVMEFPERWRAKDSGGSPA
jgi:hypothetical protein